MPTATAIVTGASSGIGLSTCTLLLQAGWSVLGVDVATSCPIADSEHFGFISRNLAAPFSPLDVVGAALTKFGRIDALVNVAGIMDNLSSVDTLDDAVWERVIAVNLTAPVRLMREATKVFLAQKAEGKGSGGSVVNVASYAGISGGAAGVAYTASKSGLIGVTKQTAFRFRKEGIRCNAVCPGGVATSISNSIDMTKLDMASAQLLGEIRNVAQPDELVLQPDAIASMLVHLVSDASKGTNGAVIPIDNGWSTI